MKKIIFFTVIILFALPVQAEANLLLDKKNVKDILLDISEKIESLEKIFLIPDNGFIEDGDASIALVELDKIRLKLKKIEGEIEQIEYKLNSQLNYINNNIEKISAILKIYDSSFELDKDVIKSNKNDTNFLDGLDDINELNDFKSLKRAKIYFENAEYDNAKIIYENFVKSFPNNILLPEVFFYLAETYYNTNEWKLAANSYLESFSLNPRGDFAPQSLFGLAVSLGALKQFDQACLTLEEVNLRFPSQNVVSSENILETKKILSCY